MNQGELWCCDDRVCASDRACLLVFEFCRRIRGELYVYDGSARAACRATHLAFEVVQRGFVIGVLWIKSKSGLPIRKRRLKGIILGFLNQILCSFRIGLQIGD